MKLSNYNNFNKFSDMKNPQNSRSVSPDVMYKYHTHVNIPWNIPQYLPVRAYLDPNRQKTQRKYLERPKGKPDNKYKTKKGFYMDDHLKIMKPLPPPSHYNLKDPFDQGDNLKRGRFNKVNKSLIKYNYLEWIQMEQKNRKKPAPGDYNLNKTDEQINQQLRELKSKRVNSGEKLFFYQQNEHLSNSVPGMGAYNPHLSVPHFRPDKRDHKFWIDKHKKMSQTFHKKRLSEPAPGSYSPLPMDMTTFDGIKTADLINKRRKSAKATGFGTDAKFPYQRKSKSVIKMEKPAPSAYNTAIEWKGKNMKVDKNNWVRSVSTGLTKSIYNS